MRIFVVTATLLLVVSAGLGDANPQGFLDNFRNFFRGGRPPANRPPQPQNRPPPQFQQGAPQQPVQQFQQGAPQQPVQQFQQGAPQQPVQQFQQRPPQQQQQFQQPPPQQQQQFRQPAPQQQQQQQFRQPAQQQFRQPAQQQQFRQPAQQQQVPPQQQFQSQPVANPAPAAAAAACDASLKPGLNGCPGACPNEIDGSNRKFIITYKINDVQCSNFTGEEAEEYCTLQGGHAVSLDDNAKTLYFINIAIRDKRRYFWTGGRINHAIGTVTWPSGKQEGYIRGQRFWSPTGGKEPVPEPQPDNRDGNEVCIGVLNNFYADGVKWHDVSCHHRKPTVCEL